MLPEIASIVLTFSTAADIVSIIHLNKAIREYCSCAAYSAILKHVKPLSARNFTAVTKENVQEVRAILCCPYRFTTKFHVTMRRENIFLSRINLWKHNFVATNIPIHMGTATRVTIAVTIGAGCYIYLLKEGEPKVEFTAMIDLPDTAVIEFIHTYQHILTVNVKSGNTWELLDTATINQSVVVGFSSEYTTIEITNVEITNAGIRS